MHYILIAAVIGAIIFFQVRVFLANKKRWSQFSSVFAISGAAYGVKPQDEKNKIPEIESIHKNPIFEVIIEGINIYLFNNKGTVSDYHLMRDIVERNCDAVEEEVDAQIPVPLYFGLAGTMMGILVGIGYLVFSGDLSKLLGATEGSGGAEGVNALMAGVALAMISSIVGIVLTTVGSTRAKDAKVEHEKNKNIFLGWMQAELLPQLAGSTGGVLEKVSKNLTSFNKTFSENVEGLREAFVGIKDTASVINDLHIDDIATANIKVYEELRGCTAEIGQLSTYLHNVNSYLADVRTLTEKLDDAQQRSQSIEKMAAFFEAEIEQVEARKGAINKAVGTVDETLSKSFAALSQHAAAQLEQFNTSTIKQQQALERRLDETSMLVHELKNLPEIKASLTALAQAAKEQNHNMERFAQGVEKLSAMEVSSEPRNAAAPASSTPQWMKAAIIGIGVLVSAACVIFIVNQCV